MAKKKDTVKIQKTAAKKALQAAKTYEKNVQKGTEKKYSDADKALDDIKKYLNKDGSISKSKTRSKKSKAAFNAAVNKFNSIAGSKKARQTNLHNKNVAEAAASLQKQGKFNKPGSGSEKAEQAAEIFMRNTLPLFKQFSASDAVLELTDSGFNIEEIDDILEYLDTQLNTSIPEELQSFRSDDDITVFLDNLTGLMDTLNENGDSRDVSDLINIADHMTQYGLDDFEDALYNNDDFGDNEDDF